MRSRKASPRKMLPRSKNSLKKRVRRSKLSKTVLPHDVTHISTLDGGLLPGTGARRRTAFSAFFSPGRLIRIPAGRFDAQRRPHATGRGRCAVRRPDETGAI